MVRSYMPLAGFAYGATLSVIGLMTAGIGHGAYVVLGWSASPFSLLNSVLVAIIAPPIWWTIIGVFAAISDRGWARWTVVAAMVAHYGALPLVLSNHAHFGDWGYVDQVKLGVALGTMIYLGGQVALWAAVCAMARHKPVGVCRRCGYALVGLPTHRCPECGETF